MENKLSFMKKSIKGLFVIGMTVQICLGAIWMFANLFSMQRFSEAAAYIEMSSSFVLDEYTGVLYPALLFCLRFVFGEKIWFTALYVLQMVTAFVCNCFFCKSTGIGGKKMFSGKNMFAASYLLTIPFVLQLHLAVLPISLVYSLFMLQLGLCVTLYRNGGGRKQLVYVCALWGIMSLFAPDYLWLGAIPLLWMLWHAVRQKWQKKEKVFLAVGMVVVVVVNGLTNAAFVESGSRGSIQKTAGAAMVSRLAWPHFEKNYYFWPEEVKAIMSLATARDIDRYADNVKLIVGPLFEEAFGKEQANTYYWEMALQCVSDRTKEILSQIGEDFAAYLFVPYAVYHQLSGNGYSYSGWNFDRLWEQEKGLTGFYVEYSLYSFMIGMALILLYGIIRCIYTKRFPARNGISVLFVLCMLTQAVWYTMSGAYMMDYKNVPVIMTLWYAIVLWGTEKITLREC